MLVKGLSDGFEAALAKEREESEARAAAEESQRQELEELSRQLGEDDDGEFE